jgi:hypothetical protein
MLTDPGDWCRFALIWFGVFCVVVAIVGLLYGSGKKDKK